MDIFSGLKINDTLFFCLGVLCPFISPTKSEQTQINEKNIEMVFLFSNEKSFTKAQRSWQHPKLRLRHFQLKTL